MNSSLPNHQLQKKFYLEWGAVLLKRSASVESPGTTSHALHFQNALMYSVITRIDSLCRIGWLEACSPFSYLY